MSPSPRASPPLFPGSFRTGCAATPPAMTGLPLALSSDHAAAQQRQPAAHPGAHSYQQDVVPLPRRAAGHRAPEKARRRPGRGGAPREALHGGPGRLGARGPGIDLSEAHPRSDVAATFHWGPVALGLSGASSGLAQLCFSTLERWLSVEIILQAFTVRRAGSQRSQRCLLVAGGLFCTL